MNYVEAKPRRAVPLGSDGTLMAQLFTGTDHRTFASRKLHSPAFSGLVLSAPSEPTLLCRYSIIGTANSENETRAIDLKWIYDTFRPRLLLVTFPSPGDFESYLGVGGWAATGSANSELFEALEPFYLAGRLVFVGTGSWPVAERNMEDAKRIAQRHAHPAVLRYEASLSPQQEIRHPQLIKATRLSNERGSLFGHRLEF